MVLNRFVAAAAIAIGATCSPAAAADRDPPARAAYCAGLTGHDEKLLERLPREYIEDVDRLMDAPLPPLFPTDRVSDKEPALLGIVVTVRPVEGLTVERLQRLVKCGLMRAAAADPQRPTDWPRTPAGTRPEVYSGGDKFIVILLAPDAAAADALWRSAQQLKPR